MSEAESLVKADVAKGKKLLLLAKKSGHKPINESSGVNGLRSVYAWAELKRSSIGY